MTQSVKLSISDPLVKRIVCATYPAYRGRKITLVSQSYPLDCKSYWEGGSCSYFTFLRLDTFQRAEMPAQSAFDTQIQGAESVMLPENIACVEHCFFCGKDLGLRIHVNPANVTKLLPVGGAQ
jgi:hypothetical protein